ncbi:hypothetical protein GFL82_15655 [Rhizobium laguerreae]|nr:hypothetical protein [Rhizobium laguerreae]
MKTHFRPTWRALLSSIPAFIAELVRAVNQSENLTPGEVRLLLNRSIASIVGLRDRTGVIPIVEETADLHPDCNGGSRTRSRNAIFAGIALPRSVVPVVNQRNMLIRL